MKTIYKLSFLSLMLLYSGMATGQEKDTTYWKNKLRVGLNLNQAAFSGNWTAGGQNSIGFNSYLNFKADYAKGNKTWENEIDLLYGSINTEGQGVRKNNDRIFLDSKYGIGIGKKWKTFFAVNFLSQFAKGNRYENDANGIERDTVISSFMAPGYLTFSWGFEYVPVDYFKLRLSPLAPRFTFQINDEVADNVDDNYGVDLGKKVRAEWLAFQLMADFDKDLAKNLNLKWRYVLFINYQEMSFDSWDHRLDLTLSAKIAKYFDVNFSLITVYDKDQDSSVQFSESLGIGFVYTIQNYKEDKK